MFQSWYLAADTQLFILAPLLLYPLWRWRKIGVYLFAASATISVLIPFIVTYVNNLDPTFLAFAEWVTLQIPIVEDYKAINVLGMLKYFLFYFIYFYLVRSVTCLKTSILLIFTSKHTWERQHTFLGSSQDSLCTTCKRRSKFIFFNSMCFYIKYPFHFIFLVKVKL